MKLQNRKRMLWLISILVVTCGATGFVAYRSFSETTIESLGFSGTPISDENKLMMTVAYFKKCVREQKLDEIENMLDDGFEEQTLVKRHTKSDMKNHIEKLFKTRQKPAKKELNRLFVSNEADITQPVIDQNETSTSDFEMMIDSVKFDKETAMLFTRVQLVGELKDGRVEKEAVIKFVFKKKDADWKIKATENAADFFGK